MEIYEIKADSAQMKQNDLEMMLDLMNEWKEGRCQVEKIPGFHFHGNRMLPALFGSSCPYVFLELGQHLCPSIHSGWRGLMKPYCHGYDTSTPAAETA